jgi:NAD(P)H-dependent FMN reductase
MSLLQILIIGGGTREGRYGDKAAHWIASRFHDRDNVEVELVDLRDWPLPLFDQALPPARVTTADYGHPLANQWAAKVASADGFVIVSAEYNHGYTAVLKNALDWVFREWNRKPVAFVGYGGGGGARAIEQLRQVAVELELAPIRAAVHLAKDIYLATMKEPVPVDPALFSASEPAAKVLVDELLWWSWTLRRGREG